jgi:hypothetical protein
MLGVLTLAPVLLFSGCGSTSHPAATVNGHDIPMTAFHEQVFYKRQVTVDSGGIDQCQAGSPKAICGQLKASALTDLIDNEIVQEYADKHHISVSQADFNRAWSQIFKVRFQSNPAIVKAFAQRMRVTQADLKARIRQDMLRQAVQNQVVTATFDFAPAIRPASMYALTKKQADAIQAQLRAGTPFLTVAKTLSRDKKSGCVGAGACGDAGWIPIPLLQPYERFLLKERVGVPLGPFRLQQGYEFYLVEGVSQHHPMTTNQQVALRGLAFSKWLGRQEQHSAIKRYAAT